MAASTTLHEPRELLRPETIDLHRAYASLQEELEAVDWYNQRVDASQDETLRSVLAHNRDEEKEHACMTLEWIRRHDPAFDEMLRRYLFREGPIHDQAHDGGAGGSDGSLGVGGLREGGR
jgi:ferritin-like protein